VAETASHAQGRFNMRHAARGARVNAWAGMLGMKVMRRRQVTVGEFRKSQWTTAIRLTFSA
jgi:hypothetical protein